MRSARSSSPSSPKRILLAWSAGVILVLGAGVVYGHYSHRWGPSTNLAAAAAHLKTLPAQLGDWHRQEDLAINDGALRMLQCAGYVNRTYVNVQSGASVSIAIVVGPPGPIAVHTPEICYSSRNYSLETRREKSRLTSQSNGAHTFWETTFDSKNALSDRLRVYYAWSDGGEWTASKSPRFEFAASPLLFKLQAAGRIDETLDALGKSPRSDFLKALIDSGWRLSKG